jgi:hypothetical protein
MEKNTKTVVAITAIHALAAFLLCLGICASSASEPVKKWFMEMRCCTRRYRVLSAQAG